MDGKVVFIDHLAVRKEVQLNIRKLFKEYFSDEKNVSFVITAAVVGGVLTILVIFLKEDFIPFLLLMGFLILVKHEWYPSKQQSTQQVVFDMSMCEDTYRQLAEAIYAASKGLFKSIGVVLEKPQDLYVRQDRRYCQDNAGIYYCYVCNAWKEFSGSLANLQDAVNEELYRRSMPGCPVPIVLKMEVTDNKLSILATTVNNEKTLFDMYDKVMHYRIVRVNVDKKDDDF